MRLELPSPDYLVKHCDTSLAFFAAALWATNSPQASLGFWLAREATRIIDWKYSPPPAYNDSPRQVPRSQDVMRGSGAVIGLAIVGIELCAHVPTMIVDTTAIAFALAVVTDIKGTLQGLKAYTEAWDWFSKDHGGGKNSRITITGDGRRPVYNVAGKKPPKRAAP